MTVRLLEFINYGIFAMTSFNHLTSHKNWNTTLASWSIDIDKASGSGSDGCMHV